MQLSKGGWVTITRLGAPKLRGLTLKSWLSGEFVSLWVPKPTGMRREGVTMPRRRECWHLLGMGSLAGWQPPALSSFYQFCPREEAKAILLPF